MSHNSSARNYTFSQLGPQLSQIPNLGGSKEMNMEIALRLLVSTEPTVRAIMVLVHTWQKEFELDLGRNCRSCRGHWLSVPSEGWAL